jgi:K+-transporting ATPase KdpF subunit
MNIELLLAAAVGTGLAVFLIYSVIYPEKF